MFDRPNVDAFIKSPKTFLPVIPAKAGIQCSQLVANSLDPGFRRGDELQGFLRLHQSLEMDHIP